MSNVIALQQQLSIAQELSIEGQLNDRLFGTLESLLADLDSKSDWQYFSSKLHNECLYLCKHGRVVSSIRIGRESDHAENAKQLAIARVVNKRLRSALRRLSDDIDTYSDPGFFQSWSEAVALSCERAPARFIAKLQAA